MTARRAPAALHERGAFAWIPDREWHTSKHSPTKAEWFSGVVEDYIYEEGLGERFLPNALLVEYSDGLVEPENVYGEEFGIRRLQEAAIRVQGSVPRLVGQSLMMAAEEWAGTPEQAWTT